MPEPDLKACPWGHSMVSVNGGGLGTKFFVACDCGVAGPRRSDRLSAIEAWNAREHPCLHFWVQKTTTVVNDVAYERAYCHVCGAAKSRYHDPSKGDEFSPWSEWIRFEVVPAPALSPVLPPEIVPNQRMFYWVVRGNYFPREVDSIWTTLGEAIEAAAILGSLWSAEAVTVKGRNRKEGDE